MYIRLDESNIVREIIPDIDPVFPGVALDKRYPPDYVSGLLHVSDRTSVEQGMMWDEEEKAFVEPPYVEPPIIIPERRPTRLDIIEAQGTYTAMMTDTLLEV